MSRKIALLGSTGSIGTQALRIVKELEDVEIVALSADRNIELLEKQAREFNVKYVAVTNAEYEKKLKDNLSDTKIKVFSGPQGLCQLAKLDEADMFFNSVVGMAGLEATLQAIKAKKTIALANKEVLVCAGGIVMQSAKAAGVPILPVDSEHSAIFQCLEGNRDAKQVKRIILTASGGPFFQKTREELENITPAMALKHPNWSMGSKITIDSATLMNKGLEFIEIGRAHV